MLDKAEVEHNDVLYACLYDLIKETRDLSREFQEIGENELVGIFELILKDLLKVRDEFGAVVHLLTFSAQAINAIARNSLSENATIIDIPSPYKAWALAVSRQAVLFNRLTTLASYLDLSTGRQIVLEFASKTIERSKEYRVQRRLAYHAERDCNKSAVFPDIRRIEMPSDLSFAAYSVENWLIEKIRHSTIDKALCQKLVHYTDQIKSELKAMQKGLKVQRRLKGQIERLDQASHEVPGTEIVQIEKLKIESIRVFDFYDEIFRNAQDEMMLGLSQRFSEYALERCKMLSS